MSSGMKTVQDGDWNGVRRNFQRIASTVLGVNASPTFAGLTLSGLTAERLIWTNSAKALTSKDLVDLVAGTANEINITDDGSGGVVIGIVNPLIVAKGGIGTASLTDHGLLVGSGTAAITALGVAANGKIPIGSAGADPVLAEITGTANQITSTPGAGSITLSLPQDIHTGASPTFAGATIDSIVFGDVYDAQEEPTGFVDRTATLSWNDGTQTLTITGNHDIYIYGVKTTKGTDSIQIADTTDLYWIYYDAAGILTSSTTHPGWGLPILATVYWNTTVGFDKGLAGDERHGLVMDWATHEYLHNTVGSRYESGLAGTFDNTTLSIATGGWHDEDIEHTLASPETTCNVLYKNGSAAWEWDAGTSVYYKLNGTALRYNNGNNLADCTPNRYMAMWIFATNDISVPIVALMGQRQDTTLKNAQANNTYESLSFGELPFWEMKILYRVILRSTGSPPTYTETLDLRAVSNLPAGTYIATSHSVLTDLGKDDHTQYLLADGTRALAGAWDMGSQALTNVNIDSGVITGITDLAIGDGGTGQSTAQLAINALSAVSGGTNEHVLTKDTGTGNATWKAVAAGADVKVGIDIGATAGFLGAANNDGVLRTDGSNITYTDGGNFITLTTAQGIQTTSTPQFARIGLGVAAHASIPLHISDGSSVVNAALITSVYGLVSAYNVAVGFSILSAGPDVTDRAVFQGIRCDGTLASPTVPAGNDKVLSFLGSIYDGVDTEGTAAVDFFVDGNVSENVCPQRISFSTSATNVAGLTERLVIRSNGKIGIATTTMPHGGIGAAKFAIDGTDSSIHGPHIQFTTVSNDYPLLQILPWTHDNISLNFDSYYDGAWKSSDAGSSFSIIKTSDTLRFKYDVAAAGGAITWNDGIIMNTVGAVVISGTLSTGVITQSGTTLANTYQPLDAELTSLAALSYVAASFVKMTGANTFALRTIGETADDLEGTIDHDNLANGGAHDYAYVSGNDGATDVSAAELEELTDGSATVLHSHAGGGTDEKVKIDAAATAGYIGATDSDGVLRTGTGLTYTDGGDFVTLAVADWGVYTDEDSNTDTLLRSQAYLAQTNGWVVAYTDTGAAGNGLAGYVGATDDPAGAGFKVASLNRGIVNYNMTITFPVGAGEYFEIVCTVDPIIRWKSAGTLTPPIDQD